MEQQAKIYVAGHRGMVGSAIMRQLKQQSYTNLLTRSRQELDLLDERAVARFFDQERPDYVFIAAAKVGGIHANSTYPAEFIYQNLQIQNHLIHQAYSHNVQKLLFLGSSCIYPKLSPQPIKEEYLLTSPLEPTNEAYGIAKIAGIKMCQSYNHQYNTNFIAVMPTNLYGTQDNFHPENSHVVPGLIRRFHEAKLKGTPEVVVWGTGTPQRELLFVDDLAEACLFLMEHYNGSEVINIGTGNDMAIRELAECIRDVVGCPAELIFDSSKPDGAPRKVLDVEKINALGWHSKTSLRAGLKIVYEWYLREVVRERDLA